MAKRWSKSKGSLKAKAAEVAAAGRVGADGRKDTEIIHVRKDELPIVDRALKRYGGSGGKNPKTGKKEYKYGADTSEGHGGRNTFGSGGYGGRDARGSSGSSTAKPPQSAGPTPATDTLGQSPESAAAALGSGGAQPLGDAPAPETRALPTGVTPMDKKPRGATPYIDEPSAGQVLGTALGAAASLGAPGAGPLNATGDLETDKDGKIKPGGVTKGGWLGRGIDALTGGTPGPQTGWSADRTKGVPGDVGGSGGASGTKKSELAKASGNAAGPAATAPVDEVIPPVVGADGKTITVNPDGTLRDEDTSAAGLRAKRRYGAKPKAKV